MCSDKIDYETLEDGARAVTVTENKLGMSLGGECPGCGAGRDGFCDWMGHYTDCPEYGKMHEGEAEKAERIRYYRKAPKFIEGRM